MAADNIANMLTDGVNESAAECDPIFPSLEDASET